MQEAFQNSINNQTWATLEQKYKNKLPKLDDRSRIEADYQYGYKGSKCNQSHKINMKIFIIILTILNTYTAFGQKYADFPSFEKFYSNFGEHLKYPHGLETKQPSTVTLMKINFASNGEVQSINFSDSAFPKFVDLMQKMRNKFDFKSIYEDIKVKHNSADQVIIPIQIDYEKIGEWQSEISSDDIKKLYFFNGKPISDEYFFYPNIYYKYVVGRVNQ